MVLAWENVGTRTVTCLNVTLPTTSHMDSPGTEHGSLQCLFQPWHGPTLQRIVKQFVWDRRNKRTSSEDKEPVCLMLQSVHSGVSRSDFHSRETRTAVTLASAIESKSLMTSWFWKANLFRHKTGLHLSDTLPCHREHNNQFDAQLILSIFRRPLHVSGGSRPIIRRYNRMYTTIGTYCSF